MIHIDKLKEAKIYIQSDKFTLKEVAKSYDISPKAIYLKFKNNQRKLQLPAKFYGMLSASQQRDRSVK